MRLGLRQKLVVLVLVILIPLLAMLAFNLLRYLNDRENDQLQAHRSEALLVALGVEGTIQEAGSAARTAGTAIAEVGFPPDQAAAYLRSVRESEGGYQLAYLDLDGRVVASTSETATLGPLGEEPGFQRILQGDEIAVTGLRMLGDTPGFIVLTRITRHGAIVAVGAAVVEAARLREAVPSFVHGQAIFVTDQRGALLFSTRPEFAGYSAEERRAWTAPGALRVRAGREYTTKRTAIEGLEGQWLGSHVPLDGFGWSAAVFDPSGQALAEVASQTWVDLVAVTLVLGVSLLAGREYGKSITDPLERLTVATREIERGRFDTEVPVSSHDEIGELALNFRRMQDSLRHTIGDVQVLADSARWMSSTLELDSIARAARDYLVRILSARAVAITLESDGRAEEPLLLAPGLDPTTARVLAEAGAAAVRGLDVEREAYRMVSFQPTPELAGVAPDATTLVVLPLVVNRMLIGRIDVLAAPVAPRAEFEQADVPLAASLSQQVASAVENARMFEQQRAIADTLQDALLTEPYRIPELDIGLIYYQATVGGRVGGDFYDFIPVGPSRTAVAIGDITGKGLRAARYTTIAKGAIRTFAFDDPDPSAVLGRATKVIAEQIGVENFVTAVYLLFDLTDGCATYAVGGHPPPLLYRASTGEVEQLTGGGLPLGIDPAQGYEDYSECMQPGDRLLLYTDGLSEARRGKELFGIERVAEAFAGFGGLPARDVASGIAEGAIAFAGGQLQDDLAIIVLERRRSS